MSHIGDPAVHALAIAASDTTDLTAPTRSIYVGTTGNMTVKMYGGEIVTFSNVPVGIFPIQVLRVNSTGLTAGALVGLW
jgi:hypothetical protein